MSTRTLALLVAATVILSVAVFLFSLTVEVGDGNPVSTFLLTR